MQVVMENDVYMLITSVAVTVIALITDLRSRRIPNILTFSAITVGLMYHLVVGGGTVLLQSAEGMLLGLALFMIPYVMRGMGAGDVKLMGALGAMLGPRAIANICLFTALVGGIYALGIILLRRENNIVLRNGITYLWIIAATQKLFLPSMLREEGMPSLYYAIAIAAGTTIYTIVVLTGQKSII
jgi:prepilin peptidase CpaA